MRLEIAVEKCRYGRVHGESAYSAYAIGQTHLKTPRTSGKTGGLRPAAPRGFRQRPVAPEGGGAPSAAPRARLLRPKAALRLLRRSARSTRRGRGAFAAPEAGDARNRPARTRFPSRLPQRRGSFVLLNFGAHYYGNLTPAHIDKRPPRWFNINRFVV